MGDPAVKFAAVTAEAPPVSERVAATITALPSGVIDGGEIVVLAVKPSLWRPLFDSALWVAACVILGGVLAWMNRPFPALSLTASVQLILLVASARLGFALVRWIPTWYVLTNRRVITIQGVRAPRETTLPLVKIQAARLDASPLEKLTGLGTVTFTIVGGDDASLAWRSVSKPDFVHTKIRRAIDNTIHLRSSGV